MSVKGLHQPISDTVAGAYLRVPTYEAVASADPLQVDVVMRDLPNYNRNGEVSAIAQAAAYAVNNSATIEDPTPIEALASLRDMDVLVSSLIRHDSDSLGAIDGLEDQFIRMGRAASSPPRMTVYSYAAGNPVDDRRRSFTGSEQEDVFIDALAQGIVVLDGTVQSMSRIDLEGDGNDMEAALNQATHSLEVTKDALVEVIRKVTAEFFTCQIKPYFEPLVIGGEVVNAASGAQMQLIAIDQMLWGCEDDNPTYQQYFAHHSASLSQVQGRALDNFMQQNGGRSITGWLAEHKDEYPAATHAAVGLLKMTRKFRYPHRQIAKKNFELRPDGSTGSGSNDITLLDILIEKTEDALSKIETPD
jgi:hypothetical protein